MAFMGDVSDREVDILAPGKFPHIESLIGRHKARVSFALPSERDAKRPFAELFLAVIGFGVQQAASDVHIEYHPRWGYKINVSTMHGDIPINTSQLNLHDSAYFKTLLTTKCGVPQGSEDRSSWNAILPISFPIEWIRDMGIPIKTHFNKFPDYHIRLRSAYMRMPDGGYSFTLRLIDENRTKEIHEMNLPYAIEYELKNLHRIKSGIVLFCASTGQGKSSTQYSCIALDAMSGKRKIVTIEDPPEFILFGHGSIVHIEVTPDLTAERALEQVLRMAAKVVMIGEIRTPLMLQIALSAAATGHLVYATLHCDNSVEAFDRLYKLLPPEMKEAELSMLSAQLRAIICQRLLPLRKPTSEVGQTHLLQKKWIALNSGVDINNYTVASDEIFDRQAIVEMVLVDYDLRMAIEEFDAENIFELACKQPQFETLLQQGLRQAEIGNLSVEDCERLIGGQPIAARHKTKRLMLSEKYNLTTNEVDDVVSEYYKLRDQNLEADLDNLCLDYTSKKEVQYA